jgi:hypothetical protein
MLDFVQQKAEAKRSRLSRVIQILLSQSGEVLHQAALAAGSVILMDNTFRYGFVQSANGGSSGGLCVFSCPGCDGFTGSGDKRTGCSTVNAVCYTFLLVLFVALDCRFNISQFRPPNIRSQ